MSSAVEILLKACEYDKAGRRLEAFNLYVDGIQALNDIIKEEKDLNKKVHYQSKIKEYIERAELLKKTIQKHSSKGEVIDRIPIMDGSTGHGYKSVFGKYLTADVREIEIEDAYIREHFQFVNLIMFLELCVKKCRNLKFVKLTTTSDPNPSKSAVQKKNFRDLTGSLRSKSITLDVDFREQLHDRQIVLSNGYIIKIGRGLDYFKIQNPKYSLGMNDYDFRECRETNVDIFKSLQ